jgi:hypothetical protein
LKDSSDQSLAQSAKEAMAYANVIADGKKVQVDAAGGSEPDSRDLNPESPLFFAQEQDEVLRGLKHAAEAGSSTT